MCASLNIYTLQCITETEIDYFDVLFKQWRVCLISICSQILGSCLKEKQHQRQNFYLLYFDWYILFWPQQFYHSSFCLQKYQLLIALQQLHMNQHGKHTSLTVHINICWLFLRFLGFFKPRESRLDFDTTPFPGYISAAHYLLHKKSPKITTS